MGLDERRYCRHARSIEQLRLNCVELQMTPTRTGTHIISRAPISWACCNRGKDLRELSYLEQNVKAFLLFAMIAALTDDANYDSLIRANLARVFGERDASRWTKAIAQLYADDAILHKPDASATGMPPSVRR